MEKRRYTSREGVHIAFSCEGFSKEGAILYFGIRLCAVKLIYYIIVKMSLLKGFPVLRLCLQPRGRREHSL